MALIQETFTTKHTYDPGYGFSPHPNFQTLLLNAMNRMTAVTDDGIIHEVKWAFGNQYASEPGGAPSGTASWNANQPGSFAQSDKNAFGNTSPLGYINRESQTTEYGILTPKQIRANISPIDVVFHVLPKTIEQATFDQFTTYRKLSSIENITFEKVHDPITGSNYDTSVYKGYTLDESLQFDDVGMLNHCTTNNLISLGGWKNGGSLFIGYSNVGFTPGTPRTQYSPQVQPCFNFNTANFYDKVGNDFFSIIGDGNVLLPLNTIFDPDDNLFAEMGAKNDNTFILEFSSFLMSYGAEVWIKANCATEAGAQIDFADTFPIAILWSNENLTTFLNETGLIWSFDQNEVINLPLDEWGGVEPPDPALGDGITDPSLGFGLNQWTPSTKLTDWCASEGLDHRDGYSQMDRIKHEFKNNLQWFDSADTYPEQSVSFNTWDFWATSDKSIESVTEAYMCFYLHPNGDNFATNLQTRIDNAKFIRDNINNFAQFPQPTKWIQKPGPLNQTEYMNNAMIILDYCLRNFNWTNTFVFAMCGNMVSESTINPFREQNDGNLGETPPIDYTIDIDTDGDGWNDTDEITGGGDPDNPDTDGDGVDDGDEIDNGYNPIDPDTDGDNNPDGTDPDPIDPGEGETPPDTEIPPPDVIPPIPPADSSGANLGVYAVDEIGFRDLNAFLWGADFSANGIANLYSNPIDAVIGYRFYPFDLAYLDRTNSLQQVTLQVGTADTGITGGYVSSERYDGTISLGYMYLEGEYGNYLDYAPHSEYEMFIPFCGTVMLDPAIFVNTQIQLDYIIDVSTGSCIAYVYANNILQLQIPGSIGKDIPVTGTNQNQRKAGIALGAMMITTGIITDGDQLTEAGIDRVQSSFPYHISKGNPPSDGASMFGYRDAFIIARVPKVADTSTVDNSFHKSLIGQPSATSGFLRDYSGFTAISDIRLEGLNCTADEKEEIKDIMKKGIFVMP